MLYPFAIGYDLTVSEIPVIDSVFEVNLIIRFLVIFMLRFIDTQHSSSNFSQNDVVQLLNSITPLYNSFFLPCPLSYSPYAAASAASLSALRALFSNKPSSSLPRSFVVYRPLPATSIRS